jgi:hypothetical protein
MRLRFLLPLPRSCCTLLRPGRSPLYMSIWVTVTSPS